MNSDSRYVQIGNGPQAGMYSPQVPVQPNQAGIQQYPQQGQGYPQQGYAQPPGPYSPYPLVPLPASGIELLKVLNGVYLSQKPNVLEKFTGFELENKYRFFPIDQNGNKGGNMIFKAKENSDAIARQFLGGGRAFHMYLKLTSGQMELGDFLLLQKTSTCCRFDRGEMQVTLLEGGPRIIGFIYGPCTCCELQLQILDINRQVRFTIRGGGCQCGILCPGCPCEPCRVVDFTLYDAVGNPISTMRRRTDFLAQLISNADDFILGFPAGTSVEDKCLLISSLIMMDYAYFEDQHRNNYESR
eukprot:TRINITY_DN8440_c0_g1_i1.p1 TRINITY_DN8440_c0_g1~~TRINITY_DN8440_c0_g1_i1.p1  ORF type:complete len:300 (+),score=33.08 TRINITY_DN8440_c0_g1_i1:38-937(+)